MKRSGRMLLGAALLALLALTAICLWHAAGPSLPGSPVPSGRPAQNPAPKSAGQPQQPGVRGEPSKESPAFSTSRPGEIGAAANRKPPAPEQKAGTAGTIPGGSGGQAAPGSAPPDMSGIDEAGVRGPAQECGPPGGVVVAVAVVGKDGELLFGPGEVRIAPENPWGVTALGALEATGLPYALSARFPDLVEAIAGQPNRGASGWMYQVNGEAPMVAAGKAPLRPGDRVIWWYSRDLGQPPPTWEDVQRR